MNYLGSVFKEKDTEMYYTDNEQNSQTHTYAIYTTSLKKRTAQLHNCTFALNYRLN